VSGNKLHLAFIGFGELGQRFTRDLVTERGVTIAAFDKLFTDPKRGTASRDAASALGVRAAMSAREAAERADVVFSAVTADQTLSVARQAATFLTCGQVFLDVNSASPDSKITAARGFDGKGVHYVEGAVMAAVKHPGITVEILAGGPRSEDVAKTLNAVGMNLKPVAKAYGKASAIKLCRSIMIKGIEALMVDCAAATKHFGVEREVYGSLAATFPSIDWPALAADMGERVATHGVRRAAEMREAAAMMKDIGLVPDLAAAVAQAQDRGAKPKSTT
jgi:3-hydroxyisobutyrate dehydrogenase-like beta-hydroxyacid dehydrogenase